MFDVAMGSYDGAEVCEMVGLYALHILSTKYPNANISLYRDDGLAVFRSTNGRVLDKTRKEFTKVLEELGLKITVQSNLKVVDYLDITLNLESRKYHPYRKPGNDPLYINAKSNHPPSIIKEIQCSTGRRISALSSDRDQFNNAAKVYNQALRTSGYNKNIQYTENTQASQQRKRNRSSKILQFNPPFSKNVQTNVAQSFLRLVNKHFGYTELSSLFNRNNTKVSYSCMPNMSSMIKNHNRKILNSASNTSAKSCNCKKKTALSSRRHMPYRQHRPFLH